LAFAIIVGLFVTGPLGFAAGCIGGFAWVRYRQAKASRILTMPLEMWVDRLRDRFFLPEVIVKVRQRMVHANDDDFYRLSSVLSTLLIEAGQYGDAERVIDQAICRYPHDVRFPIAKASLLLYFIKDPQRALECINEALARAYRTGFFRREALAMKARILLELRDGAELSRVLEEIMSLKMIEGIPDLGPERDFVDRAPTGLIPNDLIARYDLFCPRHRPA
jgi:hypothetical protein